MSSVDSPRKFWLMKSEPDAFSYGDLESAPRSTEGWDGVRNYQARNFMRDEMAIGDGVLFYHSRIKVPAIVGEAVIVREAYPDNTALETNSPYFDPKSAEAGTSRWLQVDVQAVRRFPKPVTLAHLRNCEALGSMWVIRKGMRLSIQKVTPIEWQTVLKLGGVL